MAPYPAAHLQVARLRQQLTARQAEVEELAGGLTELERENVSLEAQVEQVTSALGEKQAQKQALEKQVSHLEQVGGAAVLVAYGGVLTPAGLVLRVCATLSRSSSGVHRFAAALSLGPPRPAPVLCPLVPILDLPTAVIVACPPWGRARPGAALWSATPAPVNLDST